MAWHELEHRKVRARLADEQGPGPTLPERVTDGTREAVRTMGRKRVFAPVSGPLRLAGAVRDELDDPLTPVLAVGSAAEAILGSVLDALLVIGALDLNALVGGVQRMRAERALSGLLAKQKRKARVTAEDTRSRPHLVDAAKLSPGDVIELRVDDVVPADARIVAEDGLEVDESALTGESLPADKDVDPTPDAAVPDRRCMVFEGTTVVAGHARAVVVYTGDHTEAARAVALAARRPPSAGVQARLRELTDKALPLTLAGGAGVTALSLLRGTPIRRAVSGGVAVAVAAVPEGLPLVATVAQLAAARRLSSRGVLVRAPRTLEALGQMDTVCFDKTGTLTENRLRLVRVTEADGTVRRPDEKAADDTLRSAARACPRLAAGTDRPVHATDEAVLDAAAPDPDWTQSEGLPFEAGRGYAAAVGRTPEMLLVNLFTDLFPAMAVAVTPKEADTAATGEADAGPSAGPAGSDGTELLGAPLIRKIRHRALTTALGGTAAWLFGRFTPGTARRSTTMALCAVVGTQLAQTLADRKDSPLVRVTALGSAAVLVVLVETPGVSRVFGCTPLGPVAWAGVAASIAVAAAGGRAVPYLERLVLRQVPARGDL